MESTGYFMNKWDKIANETNDSASMKSIEQLELAEERDRLPPKAMEIFSKADSIL